jgi:hypothetical protein
MSEDQEFWTLLRQALLMIVDAIERFKLHLAAELRTAELRKQRRIASD